MSKTYKIPATLKRFERAGKIIIINPEVPAWLVTNKLGELILNLFDGKNSINDVIDIVISGLGKKESDKITKFCKGLINSGIFDEPVQEIRHRYNLNIVHLALSEKCNLKCKYCYVEGRVIDNKNVLKLDEYKQIIDEILEFSPQCVFHITGGEPLLNPDWKEITSYIKQKGGRTWLMSNGTFFSEKNIQDIAKLFDNVSISIDGSSAKIHNMTRGNNYHKIEQAIQLMDKYGVNYRLSMTVCKTNIHDVETMADKYGSKLIFQPLFPVLEDTTDELAINGNEYYNALNIANGVVVMSDYKMMLKKSKINKCYKCAMGDGEISISSNGNVYPCQLLHDEKYCGGNVRDSGIIQIYNNSKKLAYCKDLTVDKIKICKECAFKYICGGACRARSFYEMGDIAKTGDFCVYEKNAILDGIIETNSENLL